MRASRKNHLSDRPIALLDPDALLGLTKGGFDGHSSTFLIYLSLLCMHMAGGVQS